MSADGFGVTAAPSPSAVAPGESVALFCPPPRGAGRVGRPGAGRAGLAAVPAPVVAGSEPRELADPAPGAQLGAPAGHGPARTRRAGADPGRDQDLFVGGTAGHRDRR